MKETTLCYIQNNNKYLMLHRIKKEEDVNKGKWIGIGGRVEDGEGIEECVLREVNEETGLTLTSYQYRGIVYFKSDKYEDEKMHLYTADGYVGELTECNEGVLEWIDRDEMFNLPMWEGDKIFLGLIRTDTNFFELVLNYEGDKLVGATINNNKIF